MPTYGSGKYGTAIYLNGNSGTLADPSIRWNGTGTDDNTKLVYTGAGFTGGAWINFSSVSTGTQDVIIFERGMSVFDPTVGNFYSLQLFRGSVGTWRLRLRVGNNTSVPVSFLSAETTNVFESLGAWNHVGFTFDIGSTESVLQFWLNGEKFGDPISTTFKFETTTTGLQRSFSVGERTLAGNSNFNGFIDDVFVTGGVHAFAIPEPGVAALLLPLLGWMGVRMRRRGLKHP
ncbi:MAG TPA: LamG-like jellyroll fold domain-containing protein [Chthoniobacteraceae bacterium]|nr:LamG-like jellyroll fold domain-containing protein [Chthoniobacteraceae bacterium]